MATWENERLSLIDEGPICVIFKTSTKKKFKRGPHYFPAERLAWSKLVLTGKNQKWNFSFFWLASLNHIKVKRLCKKKKNCFPNDEKDHILCLLNGILKWLRLLSSSKEVDSFQLQHDCITLKKPSLDGHTSNQQVNTFITSFPPYLLMCSFHASCNTSNDLESKSFLGQCKEWDKD